MTGPPTFTPVEVAAMRRQAALEVLNAAAAHSLLTDQLDELQAVRRERAFTPEESAREVELQARLADARRRHDEAHRRLRAISAFRSQAARAFAGRAAAS
jgi:hypothetical protein